MRTRRLTDVPARELRPLLEEETDLWGRELLWDYADVSAAVVSGIERGVLSGLVLQDGPRAAAYCYYMFDGGRAIVGSVFSGERYRGQGLEEQLLEAVLPEAQASPGYDRVECQTLFSTAAAADARFERAGFHSRRRHYMVCGLVERPPVPRHSFRLRPLRRDDFGAAAEVVYRSHDASLDAALNLTYASRDLCRSFVETLVVRAGCGRFDPQASQVAEGPRGIVGVLLASALSRDTGHVCQVSVLPGAQSRGLGTVLMTSALAAFRAQGLTSASLSVTVGNERAYRLYERLGFRVRREFAAHAWARPPARIELPA